MMKETARIISAVVIIAAPLLVLLYDLLVFLWFGTASTITDVIRSWSDQSIWPELVFVVAVVLLYLHLFRKMF